MRGEKVMNSGSPNLRTREKEVLRLRDEEKKTLQEIGEIFGVSKERIRQIEARARLKLKKNDPAGR